MTLIADCHKALCERHLRSLSCGRELPGCGGSHLTMNLGHAGISITSPIAEVNGLANFIYVPRGWTLSHVK
jgi:UDP-N-acetylenolpyruvoylglucosamine reductase